MDEIIRFVKALLQAEYDALAVQPSDRLDASLYRAKLEQVNSFFSTKILEDLGQIISPQDGLFEPGEKRINTELLRPRPIFQIKAYEHPELGDIFRVYVGLPWQTKEGQSGYFANYFVANTEEGLKIVSRYLLDLFAESSDSRFEDGSLSWIWSGGLEFTTLGRLVEVRKFEIPSEPASLEEFESE